MARQRLEAPVGGLLLENICTRDLRSMIKIRIFTVRGQFEFRRALNSPLSIGGVKNKVGWERFDWHCHAGQLTKLYSPWKRSLFEARGELIRSWILQFPLPSSFFQRRGTKIGYQNPNDQQPSQGIISQFCKAMKKGL